MNIPKLEEHRYIKNMIFFRESRNWTQDDMAKKLEIKRSRYGSWEEERAFPPIYYARLIAQVFKKTLEEMLTKNFTSTHENCQRI